MSAQAPPRVVVFGYDELVHDTVGVVREGGGTVAAVVFPSTHLGDPRVRHVREALDDGRTRLLEQPPRERAAEFEAAVRDLAPDLILVWSYPMRLSLPVLRAPRLASLNVHMGLLPRYRGANALQWAIANGETVTGVTLHHMEEDFDTGPMIARARLAIRADDDIISVMRLARRAGIRLLREGWPHFSTRVLPGVPQDPRDARWFPRRTREHDRIEWASSAASIRNLVRATAAPFPGAHTTWQGRPLVVRACESAPPPLDEEPGSILDVEAGGIRVATGRGGLRITRLELEDQPLDPGAFARMGALAGQRFE